MSLVCWSARDEAPDGSSTAAGRPPADPVADHPAETWLRRYGAVESVIRDAPRHGRPAVIAVRRGRFLCAACGRTFVPPVPGVARGRTMTENLVRYIAQADAGPSLAAVARRAGIDEKSARLIRGAYLHTARLAN